MQLTVQERFALLSLLPQAGDFTTLRVVRELREGLSFSDEEHKALAFEFDDHDRVRWNFAADPLKEFEFGWKQEKVIRDALEKASKDKKLTLEQLSTYEKFFPEDDAAPVPFKREATG